VPETTTAEWHAMSLDEIVLMASSQAGVRDSPAALAEMTRRSILATDSLRETMDSSSRHIETLTKRLIGYTLLLLAVSVVLVFVGLNHGH
jgi:hypothetical protein